MEGHDFRNSLPAKISRRKIEDRQTLIVYLFQANLGGGLLRTHAIQSTDRDHDAGNQ